MAQRKTASKSEVSNSYAQREMDKASEKLDRFEKEIKDLTLDRMNEAPKLETEQQTKLSNRELSNSKDIYLKPKRSIMAPPDPKTGKKEVFNEKFREDYNYAKEYVHFVAENKEIIGETINLWTKPFAGMPAEEWEVPTNKPVWGPRYLAEKIKKCSYHRMRMEDKTIVGSDHTGSYHGQMVVDNTVQRLDAYPVSDRKSVFMGASNF